MKICVICREHPTLHFNGGLSIAAWNTARAARDAGYDILFVTASHPTTPTASQPINEEGIDVLCLGNAKHDDYASWSPMVKKWWDEEGHKKDFDLIHCHGYSGWPIAQAGCEPPIIFHDHGSKAGYLQTVMTDSVLRDGGVVPPQMAEFYMQTYQGTPAPAGEDDWTHMRRYNTVIATSHISEMDFRTRYCLTNVELFYHPIYVPTWETEHETIENPPIGDRKKRPVVAVFAGDLDNPWKCGVHWLKLLEPLKDEIHLLLIGKGPVVADYAAEHFTSSYATGHVSEKVALNCLAKADVLYEPSTHHIGLNLTGISAIGLGVPVVAFPTAGHTDLIGDCDAGVVVDPTKSEMLLIAIRHVIKERETFSHNAKVRFEEMFSPKRAAKRIDEIYRNMLGVVK